MHPASPQRCQVWRVVIFFFNLIYNQTPLGTSNLLWEISLTLGKGEDFILMSLCDVIVKYKETTVSRPETSRQYREVDSALRLGMFQFLSQVPPPPPLPSVLCFPQIFLALAS